jgi:CRISPR/Cas system-associated exonuclease Cas4 (RecB family)
MGDDVIRASEIGQYAYCARAWWFARVLGYRSANQAAMQQGTAQHREHGRSVVAYHRLRRLAHGLLILAGAALAIWIIMNLRG